jgi:hypothetical protein
LAPSVAAMVLYASAEMITTKFIKTVEHQKEDEKQTGNTHDEFPSNRRIN